jgi:hypothetical protein
LGITSRGAWAQVDFERTNRPRWRSFKKWTSLYDIAERKVEQRKSLNGCSVISIRFDGSSMKKSDHTLVNGASKPPAKVYCAPKLKIYGAMSSLTAAGTRGVPEGMATSNKTRKA